VRFFFCLSSPSTVVHSAHAIDNPTSLTSATSTTISGSSQRIRTLDAIRGVALLLMLLSHSLMLLPGNLPGNGWVIISSVLLVTKAATPLFVFVFGMTMACVYLPRVGAGGNFPGVRKRMWRRALLVFLSFELIVILVGWGNGSSPEYLLRRLTFREPGNWAEVLNFYCVLLLAGPWLLKGWRTLGRTSRLLLFPLLYAAGAALSAVSVPPSLFVLKNIIAGFPVQTWKGTPPDSFPVLQLSVFVLAGLWLGELLYGSPDTAKFRRTLFVIPVIALVSFIASTLVSGESLYQFLRGTATDKFRFPPQLPYVLFGMAAVLAIATFIVWIYDVRRIDARLLRGMELLGRRSLFIFTVQYAILFPIYGRVLGLFGLQNLWLTGFWSFALILACAATSWLYERWRKGRLRTI
jgi:hypothetical protein